jgi:hypothetical protein
MLFLHSIRSAVIRSNFLRSSLAQAVRPLTRMAAMAASALVFFFGIRVALPLQADSFKADAPA